MGGREFRRVARKFKGGGKKKYRLIGFLLVNKPRIDTSRETRKKKEGPGSMNPTQSLKNAKTKAAEKKKKYEGKEKEAGGGFWSQEEKTNEEEEREGAGKEPQLIEKQD